MRQVRVRVTAAAVLVAVVVGVVGAAVFVALLHRDLERSLVESVRQQVETIDAQLAGGSTPHQAATTARDDVITQVVGPEGEILGTDHPRLTRPLRTVPGVSTGVEIGGLDESYAVVADRAASGDLVVVAHSEEQVSRARRTAVLLLSVAVPAAVLLLGVAVWVSVGRALRPVESMRREAARITTAHADRRLPTPGGDDEIARLAETLNEMLDRIDTSQRSQRQFVSDASPELRSPLAVIRQLAELAHRRPADADVLALADGVLAEERRMESMVTALLTLARLEDQEPERRPVDLDDVVLREVQRVREPGAPVVDVRSVGAGQVRGDEVLFTQVVRNLLSNAVRHARTQVTVELSEEADEVRLVVSDDGQGIPAEERERVFGRFVRLDEARTRDEGGSGLGLAIVEKVVLAAHGSVVVDDAPEGGARFIVRLPPA